MFSKTVNLKSRSEMVSFLKDHFKYDTSNSWNRSTSYAQNVKAYNLGLSYEQETKMYEIMDTDEFWMPINDLIDEFGTRHNYAWQAGFNGRSGGYIVLYQGFTKDSGYKSYCTKCGQKNYQTVEDSGNNICGRCRRASRVNYHKSPIQIGTYIGKSLDMDEDFEDWNIEQILQRVLVVQEFDKLCDDILDEVKYMLDNCAVTTEVYTVERERKTLCWEDA